MRGTGEVDAVQATESLTVPLRASRVRRLSGRSAILCWVNKPQKWLYESANGSGWMAEGHLPSLFLCERRDWRIPPLQSHITTNRSARETRNQLATGISISICASLPTFPCSPTLTFLFFLTSASCHGNPCHWENHYLCDISVVGMEITRHWEEVS